MSKQIYIDFIISELEKGNVRYNDVLQLFVIKFELSKQSYNKYWKISNEQFKNSKESKKAKLKEIDLSNSINTLKENLDLINSSLLSIIRKEQLVEEKAYDITIGKVVVYYREPSTMEIIEAIKEYNRINGI
jgi:ribosomal protein L3